jgi:hypothetical protein
MHRTIMVRNKKVGCELYDCKFLKFLGKRFRRFYMYPVYGYIGYKKNAKKRINFE